MLQRARRGLARWRCGSLRGALRSGSSLRSLALWCGGLRPSRAGRAAGATRAAGAGRAAGAAFAGACGFCC